MIAAGHAEAGNDIPVWPSTCVAKRVEGGYVLTGRKQFGSNGPAWSWLGAHAVDADVVGGPQIVHAFVARNTPGAYGGLATWDTLGDAPDAEPRHHPRRCLRARRPHRSRLCPPVTAATPTSERCRCGRSLLIASVYVGVAERALELAAAGAAAKDVHRHRAGLARLPPDGPAPGGRDVPQAERRRRRPSSGSSPIGAAGADHGEAG